MSNKDLTFSDLIFDFCVASAAAYLVYRAENPRPARRGNRKHRKLKKKYHKEIAPDIQTPISVENA